MAIRITLRFYEELNDYLPAALRKVAFQHVAPEGATVEHAVAACGVPAGEIDLVLVNGGSAPPGQRLADGDRVSVYPVFESLDISGISRLPGRPLRKLRFAVDAGLSGLADALQRSGHPVERAADDGEISDLLEKGWILLTRDGERPRRLGATRAYRVSAADPAAQMREVACRFHLDADGAVPRPPRRRRSGSP